jgi:hypothetical protein
LTRSQVYDKSNKSLVEDEESIQSSPSALFILILNNHRLLYLEETAFAPPLSAFTKTIKSFIFESHSQFILHLQNTGLSQQEAKREYPTPELKIIPISNTTNLRQFVDKYTKVESVIVKLYKTNSNSNNNPFFDNFAEKMTKIQSSVSTLKYENKTEGLNEDEIIDQLQEVASQANYHFNLRGKDTEGNTLVGSNEDIKVKVPMPEIPEELESASQAIVSKYQKLIGSGILSPPNIIDLVGDKIKQVLNKFVRARENETD